jgi:nuclear transport factor 2 (NTF2) superfamily protein
MQTDYDLVASAYSSFNARDIDSVLRTMHRDVDWPNGMEGGRVNGHSGVREYWIRQWSSLDPHVEPVSFTTDSDGRTRAQVHQTVRDLRGKVISTRWCNTSISYGKGSIRACKFAPVSPVELRQPPRVATPPSAPLNFTGESKPYRVFSS